VQQRRILLLQEQRALLRARRAEVEALITSAPEVERETSAMERELTRLQEQYVVVTRRKAEAELGQVLEERQQGGRYEVLESALVPELPVSRSRRSVLAMGVAGSVVAAISFVFLLELLQPVIRTAGQMERTLGVAPVVAIPTVRSGRNRARRAPSGTGWTTGAVSALSAALSSMLAR
jgi:Capsular polysaccharide biosynthesis protein